jgi:hypothetical protein
MVFGSFSRSFRIVKESWHVLKQDKELLIFPVISGILTIALLFSFIVPVLMSGQELSSDSPVTLALIFLLYVLSYFIVIFFNTALIAGGYERLQGGNPTLSSSLRKASEHLIAIFIWAVISATVGMILRAISRRSGLLGKIVVSIIGMAWSLMTFFVIPGIIFENKGVFNSIKSSGDLFKQTWGEQLAGRFGMGMFFGILSILVIISGFGLAFILPILFLPVIILMAIALITIGVIKAALDGIYTAALYAYAKTNQAPQGFSQETVTASK